MIKSCRQVGKTTCTPTDWWVRSFFPSLPSVLSIISTQRKKKTVHEESVGKKTLRIWGVHHSNWSVYIRAPRELCGEAAGWKLHHLLRRRTEMKKEGETAG